MPFIGTKVKKDAKIFLLDLNPASGLGSTLKGILISCPKIDFQLRQGFAQSCDTDFAKNELFGNISNYNPDLIFLVLSQNYLSQANALLQPLSTRMSARPIMVVTDGGSQDEIISLINAGIVDFITSPLKAIDIIPRIWRSIDQAYKNKTSKNILKEILGLKQLIGECPAFIAEIKKIPIVAKCDTTVLISGETGTGKELFARAIHYLSSRAGKPFMPVNCGAIPVELMENELFGHVGGSFTGAARSHNGLIHDTNSGTLFLDEIDSLSLAAQTKLLRFVQEKEYRQLGSTKVCKADVRIIAATNHDLKKTVKDGKFRQDLFYRLNIISFILPPLRERLEDVPILAKYFLAKYSSKFTKHINGFTSETLEKLLAYEWPGNVRELENIIERAVIFSNQTEIQCSDIVLPLYESTSSQESFKVAKSRVIAQFEERYLKSILLMHQGNISKAAKAAQKNRRAFWELIQKYKIDVQRFNCNSL